MVYVLIPAHNNRKEVFAVLHCISNQSYKEIKVVLIDDGSTDGTYEIVRKDFPNVVVLRGDGNLWWTGANVMGVAHVLHEARPDDFVLLLNNDLKVDREYISYLVETSIKNGRAIVGSTLVDANNPEYLEAGLRFDSSLDITANIDRVDIESRSFGMNVDVLPGRGTLVPIEVFQKIGSFNQKKLPHYGADYEFTVRAKRAGFKLVCSHKARVYADLNITGFVPSENKKIVPLRECYKLLFSKKSKTNIYYYLNYVWLCSSEEYRLKNSILSAFGILSTTLFSTVLFYPFKVLIIQPIMRVVLFVFRFLFKRYPLRASDIRKKGLDPEVLVKYDIIKPELLFGRALYYSLSSKKILNRKPQSLSRADITKIIELEKLSMNYLYKSKIFWDKVRIRIKNTREKDKIKGGV